MKLLDTSFLIDLQREWVRGEAGQATRFLETHGEETMATSVVCALEFLEGYEQLRDGEEFLSPFPQLDVTARVSRTGSRIRRQLRKQGAMIGDFDILIGATALEVGADLVTADPDHYARIPSLAVTGYRE